MRNCLRWQLRVLASAWWLLLLLPAMALLMGWEAVAALGTSLRRSGGGMEPAAVLALVLEVRHFFPLAGAVWSILFLGMDFGAEAFTLPLSRGNRRGQVFWSKYLLFLLGCLMVSLLEQAFVLLAAVPDRTGLPADFLLRCIGLRLALDLGMMALPSFLVFWGRGNPYPRLAGLVYGAALWRLMQSRYGLWLPYRQWGREEWLALWPLAALALAVPLSWAASCRGADRG